MNRRALRILLPLFAIAPWLAATRCVTTQGPPREGVALVEVAPGELARDVVDGWIARTERARGLAFVRAPLVAIVDAGDPALAALRDAAAVPLVRSSGMVFTEPLANAAVDLARDRVVAARPPAETEILVALAHLLDAQRYPHLVQTAARAPGDVGVALRALLAASALSTANGGLGPAPEEPPADPFAAPRIAAETPDAGTLFPEVPVLAAQGFLRALGDREDAFRAPPLSTEQILRVARWRAGDRPVRLAGPPPVVPGCTLARDASFGVWAQVRALLGRGGDAPSRVFAAWRGDRALAWRCAGDATAWIYVLELDDEASARAFAASGDALLPSEWAPAQHAGRRGRRAW
ncbi:MAG: hypothetical protein DCC71_24370, partial [Proteobacteria bacterium]